MNKKNNLNTNEKIGLLSQNLFGWQCYERDANGTIKLTETFKNEVKKYGSLGFLYGINRSDPWSGRDFTNGLTLEHSLKAKELMDKYIEENTSSKIPITYVEEAPHGHQALESTLLPTNNTIGASWNPKLIEQAFEYVGKEMSDRGSSIALLSVFDVLRDPRWGRSEECYSEDPYLSKKLALATVNGASKNIGVVAKHFAAQGSNIGGRNGSGADIGDRELNEIHLEPVREVLTNSNPVGVMAAYNHIDGIYCHANPSLLRTFIREKLKFKGIVMSDGCAVDNLTRQTQSDEKAVALAWNSGVDVDLWNKTFNSYNKALEQNMLSSAVLDNSVDNVLWLKDKINSIVKTNPSKDFEDKLVEESMVLLDNKGVLPFRFGNKTKVALIGPHIDNVYHLLGDYSPFQKNELDNSLLETFKLIAPSLKHTKGSNITSSDTHLLKEVIAIAKTSDVIFLTLGTSSARDFNTEFEANGALKKSDKKVEMNCGEGADTSLVSLSEAQKELFNEIYKVNKNIVAIIINGRPLEIKDVIEKSRATILAGYPGPKGAQVVVELITGKRNFSGKLPYSLPFSAGQIPCYYNYRDYNNYVDTMKLDAWKYNFGFGLSYSTFNYDNLSISQNSISVADLKSGKKVKVIVEVSNRSQIDALQTTQLYIFRHSSPYAPRNKELKGFTKDLIYAESKKEITIELGYDELKEYIGSYDWDILKGKISIKVGDPTYSLLETTLEVI